MMRTNMVVPTGALTEVLPGVRVLNDRSHNLEVDISVKAAPPPTASGDVPVLSGSPVYDQRCVANWDYEAAHPGAHALDCECQPAGSHRALVLWPESLPDGNQS